VALTGSSILAGFIIQMLTGALWQIHAAAYDTLEFGEGWVRAGVYDLKIGWTSQYALLLAAWFCIGMVCVVWPTRKPPRLPT